VPRALAALLGAVAGLALAPACGGGAASERPATVPPPARPPEPTTPSTAPVGVVHARGELSVTARVGPAGGDLSLANGARLDIPQGALGEVVEVVFAVGEPTSAFRNRDDEKTVGPSLVVSPELVALGGARFRITLPFVELPAGFESRHAAVALERQDEASSGFRGGATRTTWEHHEATATTDRKFVTELAQLPGYRVQFLVSR
jgi:hypothetical protein